MKKNIQVLLITMAMLTTSFAELYTLTDGNAFEGEFVTIIGVNAIFKGTSKNKQIKIPYEKLSKESQQKIELSQPPELALTLMKDSTGHQVGENPYIDRILDYRLYTFGVKVKQKSSKPYNFDLNVTYYAIGKEAKPNGNKYQILDKGSATFRLTEENKREFVYQSKRRVRLMTYEHRGSMMGINFDDFCIVVKDINGNIIAANATKSWMLDNYDELSKAESGWYIEPKTCVRTHPTLRKPMETIID